MDVIRRSLVDRGLSDDAITIISASWSSGTDKQYNSAWKKWCGWCEQRKIDLLQASVDEVVYFLHSPLLRARVTVQLTHTDLLSLQLCFLSIMLLLVLTYLWSGFLREFAISGLHIHVTSLQLGMLPKLPAI